MIDRASHIVLRLPRGALRQWRRVARATRLGALLSIIFTRPASASTLNVLDWTAVPFLTFYVTAACLSFAAASTLPARLLKVSTPPGRRTRLSSAELGLLAGGTSRAADVLILEDIAAGRVESRVETRRLGPLSSRRDVLVVGEQSVDRAWLASDKSEEVDDLRRGLAEEGLILSDANRQVFRRSVLLIMAPIILLGLAKVAVGLQRDKPVGVLIFSLVATAALTFVIESRSQRSTSARSFIAAYEIEHSRALRAPRSEEVITAFAIMGTSALAGTAYEAYGRLLTSENGGGCGGGGGGCGGCGG